MRRRSQAERRRIGGWGRGASRAGGGGGVWVGDRDNNRVLRFDSAATKADGAAADGVLGQVDFVSAAFARTQAGLEGPRGGLGDGLGELYVSDEANNRIMGD